MQSNSTTYESYSWTSLDHWRNKDPSIPLCKMTDIIAKMKQGDDKARIEYARFTDYCNSNPQIILLDQWENINKVLDRADMFDHLRPCTDKKDSLFRIPEYIKLDSAKSISGAANHLIFPLMCKRRTACSSTESHQMTIIPSPRYLTDKWADHYGDKEPIIVQHFIQHDGVIIKVYVARGQIHVSTRPSFINVTEDTAIIEFDSQLLPKQFDDSTASQELGSSTQSLPQAVLSSDATHIQAQKEALIDYDRLQQIADTLHGQLGLTFYGFDVLLESVTNNYYVVDVNYFPGFKNFPQFQSVFVNILKDVLVSNTPIHTHTKTRP
ncbi:unnamed protein product [Absidia cylindrospora]